MPASRQTTRLPWLVLVLAACIFISTAAAIILSFRQTLNASHSTPTFSSSYLPVIQSSTSSPAATPQGGLPVTPIPASPFPQASGESPARTQIAAALPTGSPPDQPIPTLKYSDRRRFMLYYNETSFYMHQVRGVGDLIAGVTFERLDGTGQVLNTFSGNQWAKYSSSSMADWCYRIDIIDTGNFLNPPECGERFLASVHLSPENTSIFWTHLEGSQVFRVMWKEEELTRCEISAGACEVNLP